MNKSLRFKVLARDNFTCQYCGKKGPSVNLEVDHKIPRSRGGLDTMDNLTTACFVCNRGKRDLLIKYNRKDAYVAEQIKKGELFWGRLSVAQQFLREPRIRIIKQKEQDKFDDNFRYIVHLLKYLDLDDLFDAFFFSALHEFDPSFVDIDGSYKRFVALCNEKILEKQAKRSDGASCAKE